MAGKFNDKSTRNYDEDVSKRFGFQSQIQSSNPSSNPHWSPPQGQSNPPPQGQSNPPPSAPPPVPVGHYVGPNLQFANQYPQRDKCVACARCSVCFIMFGVFLVIAGSIMLGTASNFDVGPNWNGSRPTNQLRIIGPIALAIGISLLVLSCIVISVAKSRVAANSQNTGYVANNFGGPQPVISGRTDNGIHPATQTFSNECSYHFPDNPNNAFHNRGSSTNLNHHDDHNDHHWKHDRGSTTGPGTHHNDHHGSSSHSNHHDVSSSHCHDNGASSSAFDSPPSYDTVASTCDTSPSTTTTD